MLIKPSHALFQGVIHGLFVIVAAKISSQRETMRLVLVHDQLSLDTRLLVQYLLDLLVLVDAEQAILATDSQTYRLLDGIKVTGDGP